MKKNSTLLVLLSSLAIVIAAPADQEIDFVPSESDNVAGTQDVFVPFCQEARKTIQDRLANEDDDIKSILFNVVFPTAENLADDIRNDEPKHSGGGETPSADIVIRVIFAITRQVQADQSELGQNDSDSTHAVSNACIKFKTKYFNVVSNMFHKELDKLSNSGQANGAQGIEQMECAITKRLYNANRFCHFYLATKPMVNEIIKANE